MKKQNLTRDIELLKLKASIPYKQPAKAFCNRFQEYSDPAGKVRVSNFMQGRSYSEDMHNKLIQWSNENWL